jgi:poly-gamma-glutamate capsule biosynthesis protein CapA/YwtB (metallophosphatase superfamily)
MSLVAPLRSLFSGADIALVNVESAIGEGPSPSKCGPASTNCFAFRAPLASARAVRSLAPQAQVVGNLANNHARDAGSIGQDSTVAALRRAGVLVSGDDTLPTLVPTPAGDTVAVLGFYTSNETPDARDTAEVRRLVARAADQYPIVLVTMHLGAEGRRAQHTADSTEIFLGVDRGNPVAFAEAAVRGGAAMVIGHGPHVLRAVEWSAHGAPVAYSLGNLLTYGPFVLHEPLNRGAVLCATIDTTGRVSAATLAPTMQRLAGVVARDRSRRAFALVNALGRADFPGSAARVNSRGTLTPAQQR